MDSRMSHKAGKKKGRMMLSSPKTKDGKSEIRECIQVQTT